MKRLVITGTLLCATLAHAQFWNGNKLLDNLENEDPTFRLYAAGYLAGVTDGMDGTKFCVPTQAQLKQIIEMVQNALRSEPENRHKPAADLIAERLHDQWACQVPSQKKKK